MDVEVLDSVFPKTPIVIGRLRGDRPGPTVVLNGHLDVVPIPHDPPRLEGDLIYGRGSADMKGACACAAEAARVLSESGSFAGELVIVAIGLHEAPGGRGEDLTWLLTEHGFTADLAVVCELSRPGMVVVSHMGQATAEITVSRPGTPTHELLTPKGTPHPLLAAAKVVDRDRGPVGGAGSRRAPVGRRRDLLRRRAARRRLLQPVPVDVPDHGHPAVGSREHPGGRRGRVPRAPRPRRRRDGLHDRARPEARPRPVRDRDRSPVAARAPGGPPRGHRRGAEARGDQDRRRRRALRRGRDPDRLPRPGRRGRPRRRRVHRRSRSSSGRRASTSRC